MPFPILIMGLIAKTRLKIPNGLTIVPRDYPLSFWFDQPSLKICYCVYFWFDQPSLKIPWVLCKTYLMFEILREWLENLNFWKTGFKTCVFEKHFISYSCMWFIKFNALRSFCIILLCFSKNWFFQNFDPIEIAIKNVCESLSISIGARLVLDQSKHFRPIESVFRSIENRVENFLKIYFHVFKLTFSKVFQLFLSL